MWAYVHKHEHTCPHLHACTYTTTKHGTCISLWKSKACHRTHIECIKHTNNLHVQPLIIYTKKVLITPSHTCNSRQKHQDTIHSQGNYAKSHLAWPSGSHELCNKQVMKKTQEGCSSPEQVCASGNNMSSTIHILCHLNEGLKHDIARPLVPTSYATNKLRKRLKRSVLPRSRCVRRE